MPTLRTYYSCHFYATVDDWENDDEFVALVPVHKHATHYQVDDVDDDSRHHDDMHRLHRDMGDDQRRHIEHVQLLHDHCVHYRRKRFNPEFIISINLKKNESNL